MQSSVLKSQPPYAKTHVASALSGANGGADSCANDAAVVAVIKPWHQDSRWSRLFVGLPKDAAGKILEVITRVIEKIAQMIMRLFGMILGIESKKPGEEVASAVDAAPKMIDTKGVEDVTPRFRGYADLPPACDSSSTPVFAQECDAFGASVQHMATSMLEEIFFLKGMDANGAQSQNAGQIIKDAIEATLLHMHDQRMADWMKFTSFVEETGLRRPGESFDQALQRLLESIPRDSQSAGDPQVDQAREAVARYVSCELGGLAHDAMLISVASLVLQPKEINLSSLPGDFQQRVYRELFSRWPNVFPKERDVDLNDLPKNLIEDSMRTISVEMYQRFLRASNAASHCGLRIDAMMSDLVRRAVYSSQGAAPEAREASDPSDSHERPQG